MAYGSCSSPLSSNSRLEPGHLWRHLSPPAYSGFAFVSGGLTDRARWGPRAVITDPGSVFLGAGWIAMSYRYHPYVFYGA